jgi:predicted RNA-binding Zn-ribbon protein involved in translation (DUF1610 family)
MGRHSLNTTEQLKEIIDAGVCTTQLEAAKIIGISRERVRQIVKKQGWEFGKKMTPFKEILWPCPDCGTEVRSDSSHINQRKTSYCQPCAAHHTSHMQASEMFICPDCGEILIFTKQEAARRATQHCRKCLSRIRKQELGTRTFPVTECLYGHPYDEKNTRRYGMIKICAICQRDRQAEFHARERRSQASGS